MVQQHNSIPPE